MTTVKRTDSLFQVIFERNKSRIYQANVTYNSLSFLMYGPLYWDVFSHSNNTLSLLHARNLISFLNLHGSIKVLLKCLECLLKKHIQRFQRSLSRKIPFLMLVWFYELLKYQVGQDLKQFFKSFHSNSKTIHLFLKLIASHKS
jgi:hypothetical protein